LQQRRDPREEPGLCEFATRMAGGNATTHPGGLTSQDRRCPALAAWVAGLLGNRPAWTLVVSILGKSSDED
jgi:hypothetical protein